MVLQNEVSSFDSISIRSALKSCRFSCLLLRPCRIGRLPEGCTSEVWPRVRTLCSIGVLCVRGVRGQCCACLKHAFISASTIASDWVCDEALAFEPWPAAVASVSNLRFFSPFTGHCAPCSLVCARCIKL